MIFTTVLTQINATILPLDMHYCLEFFVNSYYHTGPIPVYKSFVLTVVKLNQNSDDFIVCHCRRRPKARAQPELGSQLHQDNQDSTMVG